MPIVCINRPNRTKKRIWTPEALTRIVRDVCEEWGIEATEAAVHNGYCDVSTCDQIAMDIKDWLELALDVLEILALLEVAMGKTLGRVLTWLLKRFPIVGTVFTLVNELLGKVGSPTEGASRVRELLRRIEGLPSGSDRGNI